MKAFAGLNFFLTTKVPEFFRSNLGRQMTGYLLFYLVLWSLHLIMISLVSFFHLLLGHNIRTIGDWIGDRGWTLIIFSKMLVLYLGMQFINLKTNKLASIKSYFRNSIQAPRIEMFSALVFLTLGLCGVGQMDQNANMIFEVNRIILSLVGTFIFFSVDYLLTIVLDLFYPVREEDLKWKRLLLFPALFYFCTTATFIYELTISFKLYAFFLLLMYVGEWRRRNWTLPLLFLSAFIAPAYLLFGQDPAWGDVYSFFSPGRKISSTSILLLIIFTIGYLQYHLTKKPEFIYRD
jgi:hypothetical protein